MNEPCPFHLNCTYPCPIEARVTDEIRSKPRAKTRWEKQADTRKARIEYAGTLHKTGPDSDCYLTPNECLDINRRLAKLEKSFRYGPTNEQRSRAVYRNGKPSDGRSLST